MAGPNDILAQMGLDLTAFEQGIVRITTRIDSLEGQFSKANKGIKSIEQSSGVAARSLGAFRNVLGALGVTFSIAGIVAFGKSLINFGSDLVDTSRVTKTSIEGFQRLTGALSKVGVSAEDTKAGLHAIAQVLQTAAKGGEEGAAASRILTELGVAYAATIDPATKADDVFLTVIQHMKDHVTSTDEARKASNLFGDDLKNKLAPAAEAGRAKLAELEKGIAVIPDSVAKADKAASETLSQFDRTIKTWAANAINYIGQVAANFANFGTISRGRESEAFGAGLVSKRLARLKGKKDLTDSERRFMAKYGSGDKIAPFQEHTGITRRSDAEIKVLKVKQEEKKAAEETAKAHAKSTTELQTQYKTIVDMVKLQDSVIKLQGELADEIEVDRIKNIQKLNIEHERLSLLLKAEVDRAGSGNEHEKNRLKTLIKINEEQSRQGRAQQYLLGGEGRAEQRREENRQRRALRLVDAQNAQYEAAKNRQGADRLYGPYNPVRRDDTAIQKVQLDPATVMSITTTEIVTGGIRPR